MFLTQEDTDPNFYPENRVAVVKVSDSEFGLTATFALFRMAITILPPLWNFTVVLDALEDTIVKLLEDRLNHIGPASVPW